MVISKQTKYEKACSNGNINIVKKLLPQVDIAHDTYIGFISACINGHFDIVKYHVDNIPKLNIHINKDEPFVQACWNNHLSIAKYLYNLDEKKHNIIIKKGTPILNTYPGLSFKRIAPLTCNWLLKNFGPKSNNPLISKKILTKLSMNCAEGGHYTMFKKLIEEYDINIDKTSGQIVYWACRNYRYEILKYLVIKYGKKLNWKFEKYRAIKHLLREVVPNTESTRKIVIMLIRNNIFTLNKIILLTKELELESLASSKQAHLIEPNDIKKALKL